MMDLVVGGLEFRSEIKGGSVSGNTVNSIKFTKFGSYLNLFFAYPLPSPNGAKTPEKHI